MNKKSFVNSKSLKFIILIAFLVICWVLGRFFYIDEFQYKHYLTKFPIALSGMIFSALYVVITFFVWAAKDVFKLVGAMVYGPVLSFLFIWIGEIGNACVLFFVSRRMGRDFVESKVGKKYAGLDEKISKLSFLDLFFLRAIILVPYRVLDLLSGLSKISFKKYLLAVFIGSPVRIFVVQYFLYLFIVLFNNDYSKLVEHLSDNFTVVGLSFIYMVASLFLVFRLGFVLFRKSEV